MNLHTPQKKSNMDSTRRITFVHAPEDFYDQNYGTQFIPLWAYCLSAYVPDDWQVCILDYKKQEPREYVKSDIFAFSGINQDVNSIRRVWSSLKQMYPDAVFIIGGPITWSFEQQGQLSLLDYFDHIFILDGEQTLPTFLDAFSQGLASPKIIRADRYPLSESRKIPFHLFQPSFRKYYGGVIEVSRGCPFLCEFCDIRVLPGNNRANNKPVALIIEELNEYYNLGITHIQFVCDNFIGDLVWARECLDAVIEWKEQRGADISIFTWLTINLSRYPELMEKMRRAGFSVLFIGIESVNQNSLLETAKVQNIKAPQEAVLTIASYGFIIAPGIIFGFDSDTDTVFDDTLAFFVATGLIEGDPSFLMALPGTPLLDRIKRTGRLVENNQGVVRKKIQTNIRYLQDSEFLARGFMRFMKTYTSPQFQFARFLQHVNIIVMGGKYIPSMGPGYGSPLPYLKLQFTYTRYAKMLSLRLWILLRRPANVWAVLKGIFLVWKYKQHYSDLGAHFFYWVFSWTNMALKYRDLREEDFELHSVSQDFDISKLAPVELNEEVKRAKAKDGTKVEAQARFTNRALRKLIDDRLCDGKAEGVVAGK